MEKNIEVTFKELSVEKQREVIATTQDEMILWKGTESKDLQIRMEVQKNKKTTSKMLEKMLEEASPGEEKFIVLILKDGRLVLLEDDYKRLCTSSNATLRKCLAKEIKDLTILKYMLELEISVYKDQEAIMAILYNRHYVPEKAQIFEAYKKLTLDNRVKILRFIKDSELLYDILKFEVYENAYEVIVRILNKYNFETVEKIEYLVKNMSYSNRLECYKGLTNTNARKTFLMIEKDNSLVRVLEEGF